MVGYGMLCQSASSASVTTLSHGNRQIESKFERSKAQNVKVEMSSLIHPLPDNANYLARVGRHVLAGQLAEDHADHEAFKPFHLVIGDGGLGMSAADAGVVGEEEELAGGEHGARAHDELARLVVAAAGDGIKSDALFAQPVGGVHRGHHVLGVGRSVSYE